MPKKFAVTYEIDYIHCVIAPDIETAIQLASSALDEGAIWSDTVDMPLLFNAYEAVNGEALRFSVYCLSIHA